MTTERIVFVVMKAPVDLDGVEEFVGAFWTKGEADAVCRKGGAFRVARIEVGRVYRSGEMLDVWVRRSLNINEL